MFFNLIFYKDNHGSYTLFDVISWRVVGETCCLLIVLPVLRGSWRKPSSKQYKPQQEISNVLDQSTSWLFGGLQTEKNCATTLRTVKNGKLHVTHFLELVRIVSKGFRILCFCSLVQNNCRRELGRSSFSRMRYCKFWWWLKLDYRAEIYIYRNSYLQIKRFVYLSTTKRTEIWFNLAIHVITSII